MAIEIGSIGYNHIHDKTFFIDCPNGPGTYLFLIVKTNSRFVIDGKTYQVNKNSYVMFKPNTPCYYKASKDIYIDDWFYFDAQKEDVKYLEGQGIKFDIPVHLQNTDNFSNLIHKIALEFYSNDAYHIELKNKYTEIFFLELARVIKSKENISTQVLSSKNEKLTYLKTRLFREPEFFSGVDDMAEYMSLSRSGFQHLYKSVFGHSVIQDVIAGRIEHSKELLCQTELTIAEIAGKVGYKTEYHFMRQFKEQTGMTPTQFRNLPK